MSGLWPLLLVLASADTPPAPGTVTEIGPGVWQVRFGTPEAFTPSAMRAAEPALERLGALTAPSALPFDLSDITCDIRFARTVVRIPCGEREKHIFGFGLDPQAYNQHGLRKWLSVSASVFGKTGASHGPVPFYVSSAGYGVYVDTARVPFVHVARLDPKVSGVAAETSETEPERVATSEAELYAAREAKGAAGVVFDLAGNSSGVDVYVFAGPTMREAVQRYNLLSGGGCVPPMWGLGLKYRTHSNATQEEVLKLARAFRDMGVPCDMFGLEPGWQTHAYSCSLVWSSDRFPDPGAMVDEVSGMGFRMNLWEHAYIHPSSPLFEPLLPRSGDYLVWDGLVVDFADPEASHLFGKYHEKHLIEKGITAFKADECDRQSIDDVTPFNYPYCTRFPSGIDGDQMSQLYGYLYQQSLESVFRKRDQRTWGDVRATTALAAPLPFCLYSDAYSFEEYLRQLVNASYTGLLWSPEVREASTREELLNRIGMCSLAPQMCLNIWFMPHPIWEQFQRAKNERHELLAPEEQRDLAARIGEIVSLRMSLLPYLYAAFWRYREEGLPPVRALTLEFPEDSGTYAVDDQYMFGDSLLVAPFVGASCERTVYLPAGCDWIDFRTHKRYPGGSKCPTSGKPGDVPLYVRDNTLLPVAEPVQHVGHDTVFDITVKVFGHPNRPFTLFEDDGETFAFERGEFNRMALTWSGGEGRVARQGPFQGERYRVIGWEVVDVVPGEAIP